jgi:hypothetical protein
MHDLEKPMVRIERASPPIRFYFHSAPPFSFICQTLHLRKRNPLPWLRLRHGPDSLQVASLHRCPHRTTHQAIQPMIVPMLGTDLPLIHHSATSRYLDPVFRAQMLGKQAMPFGLVAEER